MFEVGKDLSISTPPAQSVGDLLVLCRRVSTLPQSIAGEGSRDNIRRFQIVTLRNAQSGLMAPQYVIGFLAKPRAVPEFKSHPKPSCCGLYKRSEEHTSELQS